VRYGIAHVWLVSAALAAAAIGLPHPASFALLAVAALVGWHGLAVHWRAATALAAWAIWTGFFENSLGVLTFSGPDLLRLAALGVLAVTAARLGHGVWARLAP
jgi:hypothetical protein